MLKTPIVPQIERNFKEKIIKSQEMMPHIQFSDTKKNSMMMNKNIPIAIYNSCMSPNQSNRDFSVKIANSNNGRIDMNKAFQFSPFQQNINNKMFQSQNMKNSYSDLRTSASFNSQNSSESFFSNNNNKSQFIPNNFVLFPNNIYQSHRRISSVDYPIDIQNTYFYRNNLSSKELTNIINNTNININPKINQSLQSINLNDNNTFINEKIIPNFNFKNIFHNNQINNEENYFNTQKSMEFCDQKALNNNEKANKNQNYSEPLSIDSLSKSNSSNINSISKNNNCINGNNGENHSRKKSKNYYNKFNTAKENNMNENTVILTLKIKVAKNDYRIFNLKKYDDLFISLEKFVDINKIRQELVKPLVTKIFKTLNKIFWLLNNKIGIYDQEYLNSLYKLWIKNNKEIPRTKNKNKTNSDKSTTSSSDTSSENISKEIKSNSFQNTDGNSSDEKERLHTSNSF